MKYDSKGLPIPELIENFIHAAEVSRHRKENPIKIEPTLEEIIKQQKIAIAKEERQKFFKEQQRMPTIDEMRAIDARISERISELNSNKKSSSAYTSFGK